MFAFRRDRKRALRFRAARRVVAAAAALAQRGIKVVDQEEIEQL